MYVYIATIFHPYFMGCYGPGSGPPKSYAQCSTNPRLCNTVYGETGSEGAMDLKKGGIMAGAAAAGSLLLF